MGVPNINICADSQMEYNGSHIYNGNTDLESYLSVNFMEVTGAPCFIKQIGNIDLLNTGASNATTILLSQGVEDFDFFIIMANSGATTLTNVYTTVMLPSLMWTVYNSSTAGDRITLKGASTYYVNCYFGADDAHITFQAAGKASSVRVFGVAM